MASRAAASQLAQSPGAIVGLDAIATVPMPVWKRAFDIVATVTVLVVLSPLLLAIAAAIMVDSRGGPIFRQARVGHGGRVFLCWKFRSMYRGADKLLDQLSTRNEANGPIFKLREDPRRTRVGRLLRHTSLDELPQLWNVLRGQMSLVGPRPPTIPEVLQYDPPHLSRLAATPGITGQWQVTLRSERHDFGDMVELDTRYAREMSFLLDVKILLKTIPTVLRGKGSY